MDASRAILRLKYGKFGKFTYKSFNILVIDYRLNMKYLKLSAVGTLVIGGGVAANSRLRTEAAQRCQEHNIALRIPRPGLCTDNGAMVAALGSELVKRGRDASQLSFATDSSMDITNVVA